MDRTENPVRKPLKNDERGFTLLEIIAVIVIMSILAVVAVPKYFDLQDRARERAFGAGISEAVGRVNGYFAEQILSGERPEDIVYANIETDMGDFGMTVTDGNDTITVYVYGKANTEMADLNTTLSIPRPGGL